MTLARSAALVVPLLIASSTSQVPPAGPAAVFRVRFSGDPMPEMARQVLGVLREADRDYRERLGFGPREDLTVVLENDLGVVEGIPSWADGLYDGTIRVPTADQQVTPRLAEVLRHELAHSFIDTRTRGNCPAWLQEGLAQWLEGGPPERADLQLAGPAREHALPALLTLEAPFLTREGSELRVAYAASLSASAHILRTRGVSGLRRLIESLGAGLPADEALPNALGLTYPQLQRSWAEYLSDLPETGHSTGSE